MRLIVWAPCAALSFVLVGCGTRPLAKPDAHIRPAEDRPAASIPAPVRSVPLPPAPQPREAELKYSVVVVNQPVREVLLAMARETRVNFDIHPGVEGSVNLNAIDQSLRQILTRIARQADIRWEQDGDTITVMPDTPYLKTYRVDYVNMSRDVTESTGIATQVLSGAINSGAGGGGNMAANNSTVVITSTTRNRFWETLEKNVKDLLRETDKQLPEGSNEVFVSGNAQVTTPAGVRTTTRTRPGAAGSGGTTVTTQGQTLIDTVTPGATERRGDELVQRNLTFREAASVIVNSETGVVSVRATSRQHEKVREFLDSVGGSSKRQVLIEATIVEVALDDNYQAGVDWSTIGLNNLGYTIRQSFEPPSLAATPNALGTSFFSLQFNNPSAAAGGSISSTVKLLDSFGKTRVLSSPRMMVLNNQTAILKVVDNRVYFTVKADTVTNQTTANTTFTTQQNVVPVGFIMNVTPQISENDMVTLNVRPTVTRIIDNVRDPNPQLGSIVSLIPVTQTREMESVLKVASGQTAIMGGLMLDSFEGRTNGLPIASRVPFFGDLVSQRNDVSRKSELVVFIRPVVVRDASMEGDLAAYRRYLPDRDFFRDTRSRVPCIERTLDRLEAGAGFENDCEVRGNPVVPEAPRPEGAR